MSHNPTSQHQAAARDFALLWAGRGDEKQDTSRFWIGLLGKVCQHPQPENAIEFEKRVKLTHTSFIDAYIPATHVLIEQKSIDIDLTKAYAQSDGASLT
ncbi:MAG: hypothetical protein MR215_02065, partial [Bacteroidales bacterium]|nr:hypothetical protein [Bacteroidales bacterium]